MLYPVQAPKVPCYVQLQPLLLLLLLHSAVVQSVDVSKALSWVLVHLHTSALHPCRYCSRVLDALPAVHAAVAAAPELMSTCGWMRKQQLH
jgi:hypothetical protein